jgi:hypothetical protein
MKVYLTEDGKQQIEDEIQQYKVIVSEDDQNAEYFEGKINLLEEILSSATIIVVEESWHQLFAKNMISATYNNKFKNDTLADVFEKEQTQGVIIQPKQ